MTRLGIAALVVWASLAGTARAQDAANQYNSTVHARPKRNDGHPVIVLTARELQKRGVQNLKEALDLIPEVQIRQGGMGTRLDIRGAKQRSVLLLIDGVPMDEPYNGAFELTSIPVTDIVEIRVQLSPASPLEGPGGDGGIVEVQTLHATGGKRIAAKVVGGSEPYGEAAVTGRIPLNQSGTLALRASAGAHYQQPSYPVTAADMSKGTFVDRDHQEYSALRLEWARGSDRVTADVWYGHRAYFIPPSDNTGSLLMDITGQDAARAVLGAELYRSGYRIAIGGYGELLSQATDYFTDYTLKMRASHQDLLDGRAGAAAIVERPWSVREVKGLLQARLSFDGEGASIAQTMQAPTFGWSSWGELALGGQLAWRWLSVEAAAGVLVPFENAGATWPEAKVTVAFKPIPEVSLLVIGARKGRLPTIRELYDPMQGNPSLKPEFVWHGEVQLQARPHRLVALHFSGYLRQIEGSIRLDPSAGLGNMNARNINLDTIEVRGFEAGIDVARAEILGGGITYVFEDASSPTLGLEPIPEFPGHKIDAYLSSSFWHHRMGALARIRWVSERVVQGVTLPRYQVMELDTWARIWKGIRGSLHVENLLDSSYLLLPGLTALGTTVTATVEGVWE